MRVTCLLLAVLLLIGMLSGCGSPTPRDGDTILATTYPMYYLASRLLDGVEGVEVQVMISERVSCLHDFTLTTEQMKMIDRADLIVMNGAGLEEFLDGALETVPEKKIVDCAGGGNPGDPHYWLSPQRYLSACHRAYQALIDRYPEHYRLLTLNWETMAAELYALTEEMMTALADLSCRELVTFHDGFAYFAMEAGLSIAAAIEEEEGAEAPASELKEICELIEEREIPAIFVEKNGSTNAASIIAAETGVQVFTLNTIIDGQTDYFSAMRENVRAVKEALG